MQCMPAFSGHKNKMDCIRVISKTMKKIVMSTPGGVNLFLGPFVSRRGLFATRSRYNEENKKVSCRRDSARCNVRDVGGS